MAKLSLDFACALYDRMQPLYTGEVQVAGVDLNFIPIELPRPIFDRMSGGQEFEPPAQASAGSHAPAEGRHSTPARCSAGQVASPPVQ